MNSATAPCTVPTTTPTTVIATTTDDRPSSPSAASTAWQPRTVRIRLGTNAGRAEQHPATRLGWQRHRRGLHSLARRELGARSTDRRPVDPAVSSAELGLERSATWTSPFDDVPGHADGSGSNDNDQPSERSGTTTWPPGPALERRGRSAWSHDGEVCGMDFATPATMTDPAIGHRPARQRRTATPIDRPTACLHLRRRGLRPSGDNATAGASGRRRTSSRATCSRHRLRPRSP